MAVDEALLDAAIQRNLLCLRLYRWSEPTVSLGWFQRQLTTADLQDPLSTLPRVSRLSGGGAILHHHELTYSCVIPPGHESIRPPAKLYEIAHEEIISALKAQRIPAQMRGDCDHKSELPFLCFNRWDARDVACERFKVVGSAQRRRKGAVLQHGSILLRTSKFAPQLPGIRDLHPGFDENAFATRFVEALAVRLGDSPRRCPLPVDVHNCAVKLQAGDDI